MLSDEVIEKVIERLTRRIENTNTYVLEQIGKSIKKIGTLTPTKAQQLVQIMRYGGDYDKIVKALADMTNLNVKDIYKIFEEVARNDYMFAKQFYDYRGIKYIPYDENIALKTYVDSIANLTAETYKDMARTMAFAVRKNGKVTYLPLAEAYNEILDKAILRLSMGQTTMDKEIHQTIKELALNGIKVARYEENGEVRYRRLDSTLRMHMKDALRTMHNESQQIVGQEFNSDGVEISVHLNPAPDHEDVQGKQFSTIRPSKDEPSEFEKFQDGDEAITYDGEVISPEHEGRDRRSIGQYNCYHYVFSIVLGVSKPQYTNEQLKDIIDKNNKGFEFDGKHYSNYEGTQLQRKIETEIRKQKDYQITSIATGDDDGIKEAQDKITKLTKKYRQLSQVSGLPTKMRRMRVSGYKRVATK